jgi:hypothetical protein
MQGQPLLVDISSRIMRPLVPAQFRRRIFEAVHSLAHPGSRATKRLIASLYLCPNLAAEVTAWCRECLHCHRAKVVKQPPADVQPIQVPTTAADCAEVFITGWVARYGVPAAVTSDRGVQFASAFWAAMSSRLGIKHKLTTAFHP